MGLNCLRPLPREIDPGKIRVSASGQIVPAPGYQLDLQGLRDPESDRCTMGYTGGGRIPADAPLPKGGSVAAPRPPPSVWNIAVPLAPAGRPNCEGCGAPTRSEPECRYCGRQHGPGPPPACAPTRIWK